MTATPLVVDSSIAVKWFLVDEPGWPQARQLLASHRDNECVLHAPAILWLEVLNALRSRASTESQLMRAAETLDGLRLEFAPLDAQLAAEAAALASHHGLTVYDAAFAALARRLDCEVVTADRRLAESGACRARLIE